MVDYLIRPALISFIVTLIGIRLTISLAHRRGWLDAGEQGRPQDIHTKPTPRLGGLAVFVGLIAGVGALNPQLLTQTSMLTFLAASGLMVGVGLADDLFNLNPYLRLITNTLSAAIIVFSGVRIEFVTNPLGGGVIQLGQLFNGWVSIGLSIIWLVWVTNVISWSKGVDGQFPGLVSLGLLAVGGLSLRFLPDANAWLVFILSLSASAAFAGLLFFNIYPQKIMPGYSAGSLGGFWLGVVSIMSSAKLATLFIVMGLPLLDGIFAVIRRLKQGRSPVWGDDGHLHHLLLKQLGLSRLQVAGFYWVTTFILGLIGLHLRSYQKMFTIALVTILFASFIIWLKHFFIILKPPGSSSGSRT